MATGKDLSNDDHRKLLSAIVGTFKSSYYERFGVEPPKIFVGLRFGDSLACASEIEPRELSRMLRKVADTLDGVDVEEAAAAHTN